MMATKDYKIEPFEINAAQQTKQEFFSVAVK
jgi:hypothetical protein